MLTVRIEKRTMDPDGRRDDKSLYFCPPVCAANVSLS
jgi:hypothetical protein